MIYSLATSESLTTEPPHFHAVIDSDVFTFIGPKPASFPFVPPKTTHLKPSPREATMPNFFTPGWVTSSLPYMGFAPSSNPFKCDFFRCLDFSAQALPIVGDADCGYGLKPSLKTDWDSLERNIRVFLRACMKVNGVGVPDDLRLWSFPLQYGYSRTYTTLDDARAAAYRSRQAFIPLIASVSFFLHLLYHMQNKWVTLLATDTRVGLPNPNPFWSARQNAEAERRRGPVPSKWNWQERLQKETFISTEWLSYFYEIMEIPMVGFFMDVHNSGCLPWLNIFLETKMPVALYWGTVQNWSIPGALSPALPFPTGVMVKSLISKQSPYSPIEPILLNTQHRSTRTRQLRLPRIDGGTQPRRNEGVFEFLKRRASDKDRAIATESAKDRQSRLQREENASKDMPPGRKGARVYYWDLVEGIRVRTAVGRSNYEDIWERYGPRQRCYDAVADEWDICTELDPNDEPSFGDDDDEDDDDYFITPQSIINQEIDHHHHLSSSNAYLARLQSSSRSRDPVIFNEEIDNVVKHRFGFILRDNHSNRPVKFSAGVWGQALALIGYGRQPRPSLRNSQSELALCSFLFDLLKATNLASAPRNFDLVSLQPPLPFEVDVLPSRDRLYFLLQAPEAHDNEPFHLAFSSAGTVMEIARRNWGPRTADLLQNLIKGGFSFNTLSVYYPPTGYLPPPQRKSVLLGRRPCGFSPGLEEYRSYEHRRDIFLRSVRGRAAILAGGLIARLAREVVNVNDVLDGPTERALHGQNALCVWDPRQKAAFWDDELTEDEIDLICGTYEIATEIMSKDGEPQYAIRSWWPRPISWKFCGLNVGYWSSDAENWFQSRLKGILERPGSIKILTNNQWRSTLKFSKDAPRLSQKNDLLAAEYLRSFLKF